MENVLGYNRLTSTQSLINEINKALTIPDDVGRSEQLVCSCGSKLVKTIGGYHCGNAKCSG